MNKQVERVNEKRTQEHYKKTPKIVKLIFKTKHIATNKQGETLRDCDGYYLRYVREERKTYSTPKSKNAKRKKKRYNI